MYGSELARLTDIGTIVESLSTYLTTEGLTVGSTDEEAASIDETTAEQG